MGTRTKHPVLFCFFAPFWPLPSVFIPAMLSCSILPPCGPACTLHACVRLHSQRCEEENVHVVWGLQRSSWFCHWEVLLHRGLIAPIFLCQRFGTLMMAGMENSTNTFAYEWEYYYDYVDPVTVDESKLKYNKCKSLCLSLIKASFFVFLFLW